MKWQIINAIFKYINLNIYGEDTLTENTHQDMILVVDDEQLVSDIIVRCLEGEEIDEQRKKFLLCPPIFDVFLRVLPKLHRIRLELQDPNENGTGGIAYGS